MGQHRSTQRLWSEEGLHAKLPQSFHGRFRDEFLNTELFATVAKAQRIADRWRWEYKPSGHIRPSGCVRPWEQIKLQHDHPLSWRLDQ